MNIKIVFSYDGSYFSGFSKQKDQNIKTVQSELEQTLSNIYGEKISIFASGRTDKYVHAINQVANFKTKKNIPIENIKKALNDKLKNIYIKDICYVSETFHSRFSSKSKTYMYVINENEFNIFRINYEYQLNQKLDINKLKEIGNFFVGEKNFLSFSTTTLENSIRKVNYLKVCRWQNKIIIFVNGNGFLRNMVRMIVASMIDYSLDKKTKTDILNLFNNPKKGSSISKAPGCGLYLLQINY